jgi:hypothetical protein
MRIKGSRVVADNLYTVKNIGGAITAISGELVAVVNSLNAYLSNETEMLRSLDTSGHPLVDPTELNSAGGTFTVKDGSSDVTKAAETVFSIPSAANGGVQVFTDPSDTQYITKNGLRFSIKISGADKGDYTLSQVSTNSWNSDAEQFSVQATYGEASVTRVYKISKNPGGTDLNLSYDNPFFNLKKNASTQAWEAINNSHKITLKAGLLGFASNPPNVTWDVFGVSALDVATVNPIETFTSARSGTYLTVANETGLLRATMTVGQFLAGKAATYEALRVRATCGSASDEFTVRAAFDGAKGDKGDAGLVVTLSNDPHAISARERTLQLLDADDLADAGGYVKVYLGGVDITADAGTALGIAGGSGTPATKTQNNLTMTLVKTGDDKGKYSLSQAAGLWTATRSEVFDITATVSGTTVTRTYTINKTLSPVTVSLTATPLTMALDADGKVKTGSGNVVIKAKYSNKPTSNTTSVWSVKKIKDPDDESNDADCTASTLTGTGDIRSITPAKFVENVTGDYIGLRVKLVLTTNKNASGGGTETVTTEDEVVILATKDGPQGVKGNDGAQGPTGPTGPAGPGFGDYIELSLGSNADTNNNLGLTLHPVEIRDAAFRQTVRNTNVSLFSTPAAYAGIGGIRWDSEAVRGTAVGTAQMPASYVGTMIYISSPGFYSIDLSASIKCERIPGDFDQVNEIRGVKIKCHLTSEYSSINQMNGMTVNTSSTRAFELPPIVAFPDTAYLVPIKWTKLFSIPNGASNFKLLIAFEYDRLGGTDFVPNVRILADDGGGEGDTILRVTKVPPS